MRGGRQVTANRVSLFPRKDGARFSCKPERLQTERRTFGGDKSMATYSAICIIVACGIACAGVLPTEEIIRRSVAANERSWKARHAGRTRSGMPRRSKEQTHRKLIES